MRACVFRGVGGGVWGGGSVGGGGGVEGEGGLEDWLQ